MSPEVTAAIIAASVSFLTLIGTLAAQYLGRRATGRDTQQALEEQRKQLDKTLTEQRTRTLNERFATAAEQLGSDKPAVRLAGVYAMAGLADDWAENQQTCVDVLCAYLRMPYEPDPGDEVPGLERLSFRASREVRHTVIRVIAEHLKDDVVQSWQGLNFDFTGVVFDGGDFTSARFSGGKVSFYTARFSGTVYFTDAQFCGAWVYFSNAQFSGGKVYFNNAQFSGGVVSFTAAEFSGGEVGFGGALFSGAEIYFQDAQFSGSQVRFGSEFSGGLVDFNKAQFSRGWVGFYDAKFSGGTVSFISAEFSGTTAYFNDAEFSGGIVDFDSVRFSGGRVDFSGARFSGGRVDFVGARFTGGLVNFNKAGFSGGEVDFSGARDWSLPPAFPWTDAPPSGVELPRKDDQSQA